MTPLFIIPAFTGLVFIVCGLVMLKFPPKNINGIYGYRTPNSIKNKEQWNFAQKYASEEMLKLGCLLIVFSVIGLLYQPTAMLSSFIEITVFICTAIALIVRVESAIKTKFNTK